MCRCELKSHTYKYNMITYYNRVGWEGEQKSARCNPTRYQQLNGGSSVMSDAEEKFPPLAKKTKSEHVYNVKGNTWHERALLQPPKELLRYPRCSREVTTNYYKISKTITREQRRTQQLSLGFGKSYYDLYLHDLRRGVCSSWRTRGLEKMRMWWEWEDPIWPHCIPLARHCEKYINLGLGSWPVSGEH